MDKEFRKVKCPECGDEMYWDDSPIDDCCEDCKEEHEREQKLDDMHALLSDLAEVEVPEDPYEGDGEPDDDLDAVARADKWYNDCKKLCVTMRPLIERAKKVRG